MSLFMSALVLVRLSGQSVHSGDAVSSITYANLRLRSETRESRLIVVMLVSVFHQSCPAGSHVSQTYACKFAFFFFFFNGIKGPIF